LTALALATGIGVGLAVWQVTAATTGTREQAKSSYSLEQARAFADFPLYNAGTSTAGYPLVAVLHEQAHPVETVSFIYGECLVPEGEGGCAPPVSVQVWPACFRNPSLYRAPPLGPPFERTSVRGVPAEVFEDGTRMELHTGKATVVIFGGRRGVPDIAQALRGVNVPVSAGEVLPPPAAGVMSGELRCGPKEISLRNAEERYCAAAAPSPRRSRVPHSPRRTSCQNPSTRQSRSAWR
jgi:hypothetical protein